LVPLFRAVLVWTVVLVSVLLPRVEPPVVAAIPVVTQMSSYQAQSEMLRAHSQRVQAQQDALAQAWSNEFDTSYDAYQAKLQADAEAQAEAAQIAALSNHPPPPPEIALDIHDAFAPLGDRAVQWAFNVAWCESRYHPNSVNSSSGAAGLFQFLPSTWAFTPEHASSPFDPAANSNAAAWLYARDGPSQWVCQG
jgi:uncharacterized protein YukE